MLLWLEEAGIEIVMIMATAIAALMFVAAVASLVSEHVQMRRRRSRLSAKVHLSAPARAARLTGHHA